MKQKLTLLITLSVFIAAVHAQKTVTVISKMATRGYYSITYKVSGNSYSVPKSSIDAGGNQPKSLPADASDITIVTSYSNWGSEKNLKTFNAGRSGGTVTFSGDLAFTGISADFVSDGGGNYAEAVNENVDLIYPNGDAEAHRAARDGNVSSLQHLIDKGTTRLNTKNNRGFTPLHEAVQKGCLDCIDLLLRAGADMNQQNQLGENPFVMALGLSKKDAAQKFIGNGYNAGTDAKAMEYVIQKRNEDMLKLLLDNGADPTAAINKALQLNNVGMMEMIMMNYAPVLTIEHYKKAIDARRFDVARKVLETNIDANQALDYAIEKNAPDLVQAAMEKGGDAQKVLKYGLTQRKPDLVASAVSNYKADPNVVLEEAIRTNQTDVVTLLLDNNADANNGLTYAINYNKTNFIQQMLDKGAKVTSSQIAKVAANGDNVLLPKLIQAGGDKNAALTAAMGAKKYQTAEMLIQAGATPDNIVKPAVENSQKSLLMAALDAGADPAPGLIPALTTGKKDFAELLYKAGAKTNDAEAVKAVILKGDLSFLKLMLDNQADANICMTAAVDINNTAAVQMLLQNNADARPAGLIAKAVANKNTEMTGLLLNAGADAKPAALIISAVRNRNNQLVDMLLKAGASPQNGILEAVAANDAAMTKTLITAGADARSSQLLNTAVAKNNAELTGLLIDAGANPADGVNTAVATNANMVLALLITKGVDVKNAAYVKTAIKNNNLPVLSQLIAAGNDMTYKDEAGNNYLHLAAASEADAVVAALAAAGVKVNDLNNAKDAPIHIAVTQGRKEVELVEAFLAAGADANALNAAGKKPLDLAKGTRIKKRLKEAGGSKD
jgi:ankyrin repeat protein